MCVFCVMCTIQNYHLEILQNVFSASWNHLLLQSVWTNSSTFSHRRNIVRRTKKRTCEHMRPENKLLPHNLVWMRWRLVPYVSAANLLRIVFTAAMESIGKSAIDGLILVRNDQVWWLNLFSFGLDRFTPIRLSISADKKRFSHSEMAAMTNWFE